MTRDEIQKIWIDDESINIQTTNGRVAFEKFSEYRRLNNATNEQRKAYIINDFGIYWPDIDEDFSFDGFFKKTRNELSDLIKMYPVINVSALARRLGIAQPLFAAYVSGAKNPSSDRISIIKNELRKIGKELADV